jgi:hypothetical protein
MPEAIPIPRWRFPLLGPYNGFTGLERARGAQLMWWAIAAGVLPKPTSCSICQAIQGRFQYHSEDYYDPLHPHAICVSCHMSLHRRFRSPRSWLKLVAANMREGAWFVGLRLEPVDFAGELRRTHGMRVADILARVLDKLPPAVPRPTGSLIGTGGALPN